MVGRRGAVLVLAVAIGLVTRASGSASERSELLVAQGQAAYRAGRVAEARERFAAAVAADPDDAAAEYGLGLALAKLGRWDEAEPPLEKALALRPGFDAARRALGLVAQHRGEAARTDSGAAAHAQDRTVAGAARDYLDRLGGGTGAASKRWELRGTAGIAYDSNPALESHDVHEHRDQAVFVLGAHARYDLVQRERALVRFDYDLYQTLLPDFQDFDFRSHQLVGTASYGLRRWLWAGIQGGFNYYSLGSHPYLEEPFVLPFLSFAEGTRGRTQLIYRHGQGGYLSSPFEDVRDGQTNLAAIDQTVLFAGGSRYLTFGYQFNREDPRTSAGNDYDRDANAAYLGGGFPAWWKTDVELLYRYQNDAYTHLNSHTDFTKKREDDEHRFYTGVRRGFGQHLNATLAYVGTANRSNIGLFDYRRSVLSLIFEVTY